MKKPNIKSKINKIVIVALVLTIISFMVFVSIILGIDLLSIIPRGNRGVFTDIIGFIIIFIIPLLFMIFSIIVSFIEFIKKRNRIICAIVFVLNIIIVSVIVMLIIFPELYSNVSTSIEKNNHIQFINSKPNKANIASDYEWSGAEFEPYMSQQWNKITNSQLSGFSPFEKLTENVERDCSLTHPDYIYSYIANGGDEMDGLCVRGFWFETPSGKKINSMKELINEFAPIDSEAEAVSFVAINRYSNFVRMDSENDFVSDEIPFGYTLKINNGYLVMFSHERENAGDGRGCFFTDDEVFLVSNSGQVSYVYINNIKGSIFKKIVDGEKGVTGNMFNYSMLCVD